MIQPGPVDNALQPPAPSLTLPPIEDKLLRKRVHDFFKTERRLPPMDTETVQPPDQSRTRAKAAGAIRIFLKRQVRTRPPCWRISRL